MGIQQEIGLAPMPAVALILSRFDRQQLEAFVTVAIDLMDVADGDPDGEADDRAGETLGVEDDATEPLDEAPDSEDEPDFTGKTWTDGLPGCSSDAEPDGDAQGDQAWVESVKQPGAMMTGGQEDDEDGDQDRSFDEGEPDYARYRGEGPGCTIADPDACEAGDDRIMSGPNTAGWLYSQDTGPGDPEDAEHWMMTDNVPMPHTVSAEFNIFSDRREVLGITNLQSSFQTNGSEVRSADTGAILVTRHDLNKREADGVPV